MMALLARTQTGVIHHVKPMTAARALVRMSGRVVPAQLLPTVQRQKRLAYAYM